MVTSRIRFTAQQKADLWERWRNGQSAAATRFTILVKIPRRDTTTVVAALVKHIRKPPRSSDAH